MPIRSAGILDLIGASILSKYLSNTLFTCPIGWSYGTCIQLKIIHTKGSSKIIEIVNM